MTTKWVDTNKGGTSRPKYRSSLVGHEVKYDETRSLFRHSTIGDAEVIVFHVCKRSDKGSKPYRLAVIDIKRASFYALARSPIFIEIPKWDLELGDEGCVGQLHLSLYGARDAAQNWAHEYTTFLLILGIPGGARISVQLYASGQTCPLGRPW